MVLERRSGTRTYIDNQGLLFIHSGTTHRTKANLYITTGPNRGRRVWKCKHCSETQFAGANGKNKINHLKLAHGISQHGNKVPINPMDKHIKPRDDNRAVLIRESDYTINLVTTVHKDPITEALVYFAVLYQLSFSLVTGTLFIEFLKTLYPTIEKILLSASDTIRKYIIEMYTARKQQKLAQLARVQGIIHFSFDLWTSLNHLALIGIIAHYIDDFGYNQSVRTFLQYYVATDVNTRFTLDPYRYPIAKRPLYG